MHSAYGIPESRILGGPKWLATQRFDIEAKMSAPAADQLHKLPRNQRHPQLQSMFQQLLADRFHLKVHWETRELPVYALIVTKSGPKLKPSASSDGTGTSSGNGLYTARDISVPALADSPHPGTRLRARPRRHRQDRPPRPIRHSPPLDSGEKQCPEPESTVPLSDSGPSIFTAIQEQLGLKLEPN